MDVGAPVAAGTDRTAVNVVESSSSESLDFAEPGFALPEATEERRRGLGQLVPPTIARVVRGLMTWTRTPHALLLGTIFTAVLAVATLSALVVVGFIGVGTHNVPALYGPPLPDDSVGGAGSFQPPPESTAHSVFALPSPLLPEPPALESAFSQSLSTVVLQSADLASDFALLNLGSTGPDAAAGLLASYHIVYQRPLSVRGDGGFWTVAVLSVVGMYRDVETASFRLSDITPARLGLEAGLPSLSATVESAPTVADESRVLHLTGNASGVNVGVYLVQFRRGTTDAIVGVAAILGSESLAQAIRLAELQDGRIITAALPNLKP